MGNFQQKHLFLKGMNLDADPRFIQDGEYGTAWNILINNKVGGDAGIAQNVVGNLEYTKASTPVSIAGYLNTSGTYNYGYDTASYYRFSDDKCIGHAVDVQDNRVYYFVCKRAAKTVNSVSTYCPRIFMYDIVNDQLYLIYDRPALRFNPNNPIQAKYNNNNLYWNDGVNYTSQENRHLNISLTNLLPPLTAGYEFDLDISMAKCPPKSPPGWVLDIDTTKSFNFIKGRVFQFSARYIYRNGEKSRWSPYSTGCPVYPKEQQVDQVNDNFNHIVLAIDSFGVYGTSSPAISAEAPFGYYANMITFVEYAFRETSYSPWKLIKRVAYQANIATQINYPTANYNTLLIDGFPYVNKIDFYNDEAYTIIPDEDMAVPFDSIPQKSKTIEQVQGRDHLANNIEDFPTFVNTFSNNTPYNISLNQNVAVTELDNTLIASYSTSMSGITSTFTNFRVFKPNSSYPIGFVFYDRAKRKTFSYTSAALSFKTSNQEGPLDFFDKFGLFNFDGGALPSWVTSQFTHYSVVVGENKDVSWFAQTAPENVLYSAGRDINNNARLTKQIGGLYDLTSTPSDDYAKTFEAENSYRISQYYQEKFDYTSDPNTSSDYAQSTEILLDTGNFNRYNNNMPYVFTPGDRVKILSLGGTTNVDASIENDYLIKEYYRDRFIAIDIPNVDYTVGCDMYDQTPTIPTGFRIKVLVTRNGEIWYGDQSNYDNLTKIKTFNNQTLSKVSIIKPPIAPTNPAVSQDIWICVIGDDGFAKYAHANSAVSSDLFNSSSLWSDVFMTQPDSILTNVTSISVDRSGTLFPWFFICGTNGFVATFNPSASVSVTNPYIIPNTSDSVDGNLDRWYLTGIDWFGYDASGDGAIYLAVSAKATEKYGGVAVTNIDFTTGQVSGGWPGPTNFFTNYSFSTLFNDLANINQQAAETGQFGLICVGKNSAGQGAIEGFLFNASLVPTNTFQSHDSYNQRLSKVPNEFTCIKRRGEDNAAQNPFPVNGVLNTYLFYLGTVNGQVFTIGCADFSTFYGTLVSYNDNLDEYYNAYHWSTGQWDNLYWALINTNGVHNTGPTGVGIDPHDSPSPIQPVGYVVSQSPIYDIAVNDYNSNDPAMFQNQTGDVMFAGKYYGYGIGASSFFNNNTNSIFIVVAFTAGVDQLIMNYQALIEIYRPKFNTQQIYYESILGSSIFNSVSAKYYINTKTRFYPIDYNFTGYICDIDVATPNILTGDEGDCFAITKQFKGRLWTKNYRIVSMTPDASNITGNYINALDQSTAYGWQKTNGRPNLKSAVQEAISFKKTGHRFSNEYLPFSKINGLCTFDSGAEKIFPQEYEEINKLKVAADNKINGTVLLSLFSNNTISIYISRTQTTETSGERLLYQTDAVLGSFNTLSGNQGCIHPESVQEYGQKVYWWNGNKGIICRYSQDGLTPASDVYGIKSYARNKALELMSIYKNPNTSLEYTQLAPAYYDAYNDLYVLSLRIQDRTGNAVVFDEELNCFQCFYNLNDASGIAPELAVNLYNNSYSWLNGILYKHDQGAYNTFYGSKKDSYVDIITNKEPSDVKQFKNMFLESSDKWVSPFQITSKYNQKLRQLSSFDLINIKTEEGIFSIGLCKDINTVSLFTTKTGTITSVITSKTVNGVGTLFTTQLAVGYAIYSQNTYIGIVASITSNTVLVLQDFAFTAHAAQAYASPPVVTGQVSSSVNNGNVLRGQFMITTLKLDPSVTSKSELYAATVEYIASDPIKTK